MAKISRRDCLAFLGAGVCSAAEAGLAEQWQSIAAESDGTVGAAALHLGSGKVVSLRGDQRFPLASVCKFPLGAHIFAMVDERKLSLTQRIDVPRYDLYPPISPLAERWAKEKSFTVEEMVESMIAKSDNTAVQTLFRIGGSASGMAARLARWNVKGMRLDRSERQAGFDAYGVTRVPPVGQWTPDMSDGLVAKVPPAARLAAMKRFLTDPRDTGTPDATVQLLAKAYRGELMSAPLTKRLIEIMAATTTGPDRIKGLLPPGTAVGHKTGTTGTAEGLNGSTNDAGVMTLPGGRGQLAIAVYVAGSRAELPARERIIARISKAAYEAYA